MKLLWVLLLSCFSSIHATRVVGWWVGSANNPVFPIEKLPWDIYTHIRFGGPSLYPNGTTYCNTTNYEFKKVLALAHKHNTKVQWGSGIPDVHDVIWNPEVNHIRENYMNSIGDAVRECGADGIEVDYEFGDILKLGIVPPDQATIYSIFLADIKKALGPGKIVSADVSIWGIAPGNWLLGVFPWINATMLNRGDFDFINTMSYHWSRSGNLWAWEKDGWFIDKWGIDRKRVNIGIPYFSENRTKNLKLYNEPLWRGLSSFCPTIHPQDNICNGIVFVGKEMNKELGAWMKKKGFGGAFPWAANYDTMHFNNSLVKWLAKGLF